ncbi:MAG: hypothetical protein DCC44_00260 [Acidobacteria bacterium]|nr:hypothetical protein [Pyrinomonadaceae bacterium]RIJ96552.1 MAG: hypothetical protein DCC44_00260 [Acidobacteriota bacterium]
MLKKLLIFGVVGTLSVLFASSVFGQEAAPLLAPGTKVTFTVAPDKDAKFSVELKADGFAQFAWAASDSNTFLYEITDSSGKVLQKGDSSWINAAYFIAPAAGVYSIRFFLDPKAEDKKPQTSSMTYGNDFTIPKRGEVKASRKMAGYEITIVNVPDTETEAGESFVTIKKDGGLKNLLHSDVGSPAMGYSFAGTVEKSAPADERKTAALINNTPDKTGDGVPDVMLEYYSGGAHCCTTYYFIELPKEGPVAVRSVDTGNAGMIPIGKNPKGGLRFETADNAWAYWNMSFAGSPMPSVILEFKDGEAVPNFALMKKPAPSTAVLKRKAAAARKKISNEPYTDEFGQFEDAFWSEMIDLIFTGHEDLAWTYFDMVWPKAKPGKEKFLKDFKEVLGNSYYAEKGNE